MSVKVLKIDLRDCQALAIDFSGRNCYNDNIDYIAPQQFSFMDDFSFFFRISARHNWRSNEELRCNETIQNASLC